MRLNKLHFQFNNLGTSSKSNKNLQLYQKLSQQFFKSKIHCHRKNQIYRTWKVRGAAFFSFLWKIRGFSGMFSNMTPETLAYKFMKIFAHQFYCLRNGEPTPFGFIELAAWHYKEPGEKSATPIHMQICINWINFYRDKLRLHLLRRKVEGAGDFTALR